MALETIKSHQGDLCVFSLKKMDVNTLFDSIDFKLISSAGRKVTTRDMTLPPLHRGAVEWARKKFLNGPLNENGRHWKALY